MGQTVQNGELMPKDDRNLPDVLKFELEFLEQGGYGRLLREAWRARFIFEHSPTCMNFNSKDREPCGECLLMQFVPERARKTQLLAFIFRCRLAGRRLSLCTVLACSWKLRKRWAPGFVHHPSTRSANGEASDDRQSSSIAFAS